ncbi:MAG: cyclase family protein [Ignavibacteriae bacterium]|nr:cyclase family protein [Ignavibacteriota bacterium]MCB9214833.1 cyclase family protein [Ignavibacteria bacterium]
MNLTFLYNGTNHTVNTAKPIDISIPLKFGEAQPNAFYLPRAEAVVAEGGDFIGDTRRGGSCNCETITLNPHGNGTHTECIGHLSTNRIHINNTLRDSFIPALLISVSLEHDPEGNPCITRSTLNSQLSTLNSQLEALIIRTLPNDPSKLNTEWSGHNPPYLAPDATQLIRELGVRHLLLDIPSLDREDDPLLTSHRIFWELPESGQVEANPDDGRTITEMVFVPDEVEDGLYLLNLQVPPFALDAAPSRPLIYKMGSLDRSS